MIEFGVATRKELISGGMRGGERGPAPHIGYDVLDVNRYLVQSSSSLSLTRTRTPGTVPSRKKMPGKADRQFGSIGDIIFHSSVWLKPVVRLSLAVCISLAGPEKQ